MDRPKIIPLGQVDPIKILRDLMTAFSTTHWTVWRESPAYQAAEHYLARLDVHEDLLAAVKTAIQSCGCLLSERQTKHLDECPVPALKEYLARAEGRHDDL
jgi:hypothetical protein